jgi:hypothetical protein
LRVFLCLRRRVSYPDWNSLFFGHSCASLAVLLEVALDDEELGLRLVNNRDGTGDTQKMG